MTWKTNVFLAFLAGLLIMSGLYQLEILYIMATNGMWFDLPFYIIKHPDCPIGSECYWKWMSFWRDVFYAWIILGAWLLGLAMYKPLKVLHARLKKAVDT